MRFENGGLVGFMIMKAYPKEPETFKLLVYMMWMSMLYIGYTVVFPL